MPAWARLAIGVMVIGAIAITINSLRTGVVTLRGGARIERRDQPALYWTLIAAGVFVALFLTGLALPPAWGAGHSIGG